MGERAWMRAHLVTQPVTAVAIGLVWVGVFTLPRPAGTVLAVAAGAVVVAITLADLVARRRTPKPPRARWREQVRWKADVAGWPPQAVVRGTWAGIVLSYLVGFAMLAYILTIFV